jgi:hypothetical protein
VNGGAQYAIGVPVGVGVGVALGVGLGDAPYPGLIKSIDEVPRKLEYAPPQVQFAVTDAEVLVVIGPDAV